MEKRKRRATSELINRILDESPEPMSAQEMLNKVLEARVMNKAIYSTSETKKLISEMSGCGEIASKRKGVTIYHTTNERRGELDRPINRALERLVLNESRALIKMINSLPDSPGPFGSIQYGLLQISRKAKLLYMQARILELRRSEYHFLKPWENRGLDDLSMNTGLEYMPDKEPYVEEWLFFYTSVFDTITNPELTMRNPREECLGNRTH